ncbi:MAG: 50S ribosomal protein L4 [Candidatus Magasanikbacteria bacterium]|nr:50S ribosomal protein L4 [Candidatus Magasanikbacteria bacterium]
MAKINVYNKAGEVVEALEAVPEIFEVTPKPEVIHEVARAMEANARQILAHTKTRGEVRGGGKKPWRQKGTGRARVGSVRSPLWRGGGITFGPSKERNFKVKINKKTRQSVFKMVLSQKAAEGSLIVLDSFDFPEAKTKHFLELKNKLPLKVKKILVIFPPGAYENMKRASRNLKGVSQLFLSEVSCLDILKNNAILTSKEAIDYWQKTYKK